LIAQLIVPKVGRVARLRVHTGSRYINSPNCGHHTT